MVKEYIPIIFVLLICFANAQLDGIVRDEGAVPHPDCPLNEDPFHPTHLPYPGDCTKFYKCLAGLAYPLDCPLGLHWSVALNRCEWPGVANCQEENNPRSGELPIRHPDCPSEEIVAYLPYAGNCRKYYECLNGLAYARNCPVGLHWSVDLGRCDYPTLAKCESNSEDLPEVPIAISTVPTSGGNSPEDPIPHPNCPPDEDPSNPTHLPYPGDCTKFYKCQQGYAYPQSCPPGLHWSIQGNRCDYPSVAGCTSSSTTTTSIPPTPSSSSSSTTTPAITTTTTTPTKTTTTAPTTTTLAPNPGGPIPHPDCPPNENPNTPTHLPYPGDCTKFYKCQFGIAHPISCPAGLHWSVEKNQCDYPTTANCQSQSTSTTAKVPVPGHDEWSCVDGVQYYPHPTDCGKYIHCSLGVGYVKECPRGLYWNQSLLSCSFNSGTASCT